MTPTSPYPLTWSIPAAAGRLGIGRTSLYKLIDEGTIPTITIGRRRLVTDAALVAFIEQRSSAAA